jgi:hypothetical protein
MYDMTGQQQNQFLKGFNMNKFQEDLNKIKTSGVNSDEVIQNLMNAGIINQQQYNEACQKANLIQQMMRGPRG